MDGTLKEKDTEIRQLKDRIETLRGIIDCGHLSVGHLAGKLQAASVGKQADKLHWVAASVRTASRQTIMGWQLRARTASR
jgi:hypothetical protein